MVSDREYDLLINKYHITIARAQDLQEQLLTKQRQWEKRDEDFLAMEKVARELCEDILAKDPKEMVLGADYSWSHIPILELLAKARRILREYNEKRRDFMKRLMDQSETRRQEIESLNEQIMVMKRKSEMCDVPQEELKEQISREKKRQEVLSNLPDERQEVVKATDTEIIVDAYDDVDRVEEELYEDMAEIDARLRITPKSIPVSRSRKQLEQKKQRMEAKQIAHTVDLKEYAAKLDHVSWTILAVIGTKGVSVYADIESEVTKEDASITSAKCRIGMGILTSIGLVNKESILNPLKGKLYIYQLTDMGSRLFLDKYKKAPVSSEMDIIMAEHDNCVHGYGIKFVADLLRDSGAYVEVSDRNRGCPISVGNGISYIPDIVCTDKDGRKMYVEYECVNHTQTNFNAKCNKMAKVTDVLNFVVPNQNDVIRLKQEVERWIESRGEKSLSHITIRITGAYHLKDADLSDNHGWKVVYKPGTRTTPYENF